MGQESFQNVQTGSGVLSGSYSMDFRGFCMVGSVARHEASHSPDSSAEVMKNGAVLSLPLCLHGMDRDTFTFTFITYRSLHS